MGIDFPIRRLARCFTKKPIMNMTDKEKARAYDEALIVAKKRYVENPSDGYVGYANEILKELFPVLRESEDERIRKELVHLVSTVGEFYLPKLETRNKMLAYLEKQKVFSNGEGLYYYHSDGNYTFIGTSATINSEPIKTENNSVDLPNSVEINGIGVMTESEDERITDTISNCLWQCCATDFISVTQRDDALAWLEKQKETSINWMKSDNVKNPDKPYIDKVGMFYTTDGRMCYASEIEKQKEEEGYDAIPVESTLEYKLGFKAGKDSEKQKEQKSAEWNPNNEDVILFNKAVTTNPNLTPSERAKLDIIRMKFKHCNGHIATNDFDLALGERYIQGYNDGYNNAFGESKSAEWSDDIIQKAIKEVGLTQHQINWFKTNVFPPKQEWSEEDEKMLQSIIKDFRAGKASTIGQEHWLKSLKPQYTGDITMTEAYKMGKNAGIAEVKSDLPKWRKWRNGGCGNADGIPIAIVKSGTGYELVSCLGFDGQEYIMLSDLEKLPKEE